MTANELTYFTVQGHWYDVEAPDTSGSTNALQFLVVSAFVTFTPRLKPGTVVYIPNLDLDGGTTSANTALAIAPVTARILQGELQTIDRTDVAELQLLANDTHVSASLTAQGVANGALIYDVSFTNVVYASAGQTLQNFAFTAPTTSVTVDLTDPAFTRLPYNPGAY
jgi:hypothetical protein